MSFCTRWSFDTELDADYNFSKKFIYSMWNISLCYVKDYVDNLTHCSRTFFCCTTCGVSRLNVRGLSELTRFTYFDMLIRIIASRLPAELKLWTKELSAASGIEGDPSSVFSRSASASG